MKFALKICFEFEFMCRTKKSQNLATKVSHSCEIRKIPYIPDCNFNTMPFHFCSSLISKVILFPKNIFSTLIVKFLPKNQKIFQFGRNIKYDEQ